ncbi:MAG TPA: aminopeptidase P family protein [Candidatus Eisenbacteria bacterium]|nr:aminopeptidase P family protein [Candidatus Eisenbacteria bacterium]
MNLTLTSASPDLEARRRRAADALGLQDEIILIGAGEPVGIPGGMDQTYPFLSHAEYFWLADREAPGAVLAFDPHEGWVDFVPEVTERERVWDGRAENEPGTVPTRDLPAWLAARRGRVLIHLGADLPAVRHDAARTADARERFTHARRPKDEAEIARMRDAVRATAAGYARLREAIRPGATERQIQVELESGFFRAGADRTCYSSIVGTGTNSAVFHFTPGDRAAREGELVLVDAGAEVRRYGCDVTRTYPASGTFSPIQREIFEIVKRAEERAMAACAPGVETVDVHYGSCRDLVEGLIGLDILRGSADDLIAREAHLLFYPHGIGHMIGLGVRDASGALPGRPKRTEPALKNQRTDFPLQPGYTMTIEPGIYFIPAILNDPERRKRYPDCVNWEKAVSLIPMGGIRLEDNVLVTKEGRENLTAEIPKEFPA